MKITENADLFLRLRVSSVIEDSGSLSIMTETPGNFSRTLTSDLNVQLMHVSLFKCAVVVSMCH